MIKSVTFSCFEPFFSEIKQCFEELSENSDCRVIILTGAGKHFTGGLDLKESLQWGQELAEIEDSARKGHYLDKKIKLYQVLNILKSIHKNKIDYFLIGSVLRMLFHHWKYVKSQLLLAYTQHVLELALVWCPRLIFAIAPMMHGLQ